MNATLLEGHQYGVGKRHTRAFKRRIDDLLKVLPSQMASIRNFARRSRFGPIAAAPGDADGVEGEGGGWAKGGCRSGGGGRGGAGARVMAWVQVGMCGCGCRASGVSGGGVGVWCVVGV